MALCKGMKEKGGKNRGQSFIPRLLALSELIHSRSFSIAKVAGSMFARSGVASSHALCRAPVGLKHVCILSRRTISTRTLSGMYAS